MKLTLTLRAATALLLLHDVASRAVRWARLRARLAYLRMLLSAAAFDQQCAEQDAQRSGWQGQAAWRDMHLARAASARSYQGLLRVEIAGVEAALWPVRRMG
jgi:hypothetical protein